MIRVTYLYIQNGKVVGETPRHRVKNNQFYMPELAGQDVIMMELTYETEGRTPLRINRITFERISFDEHGIYDLRKASVSEETQVQLAYMYSELVELTGPLPIPIAPVVPNEDEKRVIKSYIAKKYPPLLEASPVALEYWIAVSQVKHVEEINLMKKSHRLYRKTLRDRFRRSE